MKPTEESQIREFWEWCGLHQDSFGNISISNNEPNTIEFLEYQEYPPVDLNNLWKYAIPKVLERGSNIHIHIRTGRTKVVISNAFTTHMKTNPDPALALFWAIEKVIDNE